MTRALFGTDGIRGTANRHPMTPEIAMRLGMAAGTRFRSGTDRRHSVVIGKDTRLSGYMIEPALVAGFTAVGMDVVLLGPLPTPAVAMMTRSLRADLGVMISASHNYFADNGIKLFGPDGYKLSDADEIEMEALMARPLDHGLAESRDLGRAKRIDDSQARYIEIAKAAFPRNLSLSGLRVVIDCANGAGYKVAPLALYELGAEVIPLGVNPNGFNINDACGSTDPSAMRQAVLQFRADIGIALDGDADRVLICDEKGQTVDGDQILALIGSSFAKQGILKGGGVVATVMSNLGLERYLGRQGLTLARTKVGDRYVLEHMRAKGFNVGGEQSGHVILSDYSTTGDGLLAGLQVLAVKVQSGKPISEICHLFDPAPQLLKNLRIEAKGGAQSALSNDKVKAAIAAAEQRLGDAGRLVVRASGTEPLVRVMAEGEDEALVREVVDDVLDAVRKISAAA